MFIFDASIYIWDFWRCIKSTIHNFPMKHWRWHDLLFELQAQAEAFFIGGLEHFHWRLWVKMTNIITQRTDTHSRFSFTLPLALHILYSPPTLSEWHKYLKSLPENQHPHWHLYSPGPSRYWEREKRSLRIMGSVLITFQAVATSSWVRHTHTYTHTHKYTELAS